MRVAIVQSSYIPWRGYFDIIDSVDKFVFLDDVQYTRRSWRTRNLIKTSDGTRWLTVPVQGASRSKNICEILLSDQEKWRQSHIGMFKEAYCATSYYDDASMIFKELLGRDINSLSDLNQSGIKLICDYLEISTTLICSSTLNTTGSKTDKLLGILLKVGATEYLSGPSAKAYLDEAKLDAHNISVSYKSYDYADYPQQFGMFDGQVTVLDLIANCGPSSIQHINSRSIDEQRKYQN